MNQRIAVITGASSGIGRAVAIKLAKKGVRMILNGRNEENSSVTLQAINQLGMGRNSRFVFGDVSNKETTELCINECVKTWGAPPDIFIACAGRGLPGTVVSSEWKKWELLVQTNVTGLMYQLRAIGESMISLASTNRDFVKNPLDIIVIGSSVGRNVSPFNSIYGATKFATHGLVEALRREMGPKGVRVSLIEPGLVNTNFQKSAGYDLKWFENYAKEVGPILTADDIANVIAFLLDLPGNINLDNISIRPTRQSYP